MSVENPHGEAHTEPDSEHNDWVVSGGLVMFEHTDIVCELVGAEDKEAKGGQGDTKREGDAEDVDIEKGGETLF